MSEDLFSELDAAQAGADDVFSELDSPDEPQRLWAGRPVSASAIREVAKKNGVSPDTVMRLGTDVGQFESRLASGNWFGNTLLRVSEGAQSIADTVVAGAARAVGRDDISKRVHDDRRKRQEFLSFIEKKGATADLLGERGARVYGNTVQSLTEVGTAALAGPTAIYSYAVGNAWEQGLDDGERAGLYGQELVGHAGRSAAIEGGLTFLMGRLGKSVGIDSLEESFSGARRQAVRSFLNSPTMKDKMKTAAKELGGWGAEGVEEMFVTAGQQLNEMSSDMRGDFDWAEVLESGASGVLGRGAVGAMKGLQSELQTFQKNMPDMVQGIHAAEVDLERGVNPFEVKDIDDAAEFEKQTGRKLGDQGRKSYREALNFYVDQMRSEGQTGSLVKLENDVRKLREEERQKAARIKASQEKANTGTAGESQVATEPVAEQPSMTANERAPFNLKDFEQSMLAAADPAIGEALTQPVPNVNPYILAPWESETRVQKSIRVRNQKIFEQKETIKGLRQAIVDNKRLTKEQQDSALELVRENVPQDEQHAFFNGVLSATRPSAITKLIDRVAKNVDAREHRNAVNNLKEAFKKAKNLRPEFGEQVKEIRTSVDIKQFRHRDVAATLKAWAAENPNAVVSEKDQALLDRLEAQNVTSMTAADVNDLAAKVEQLAYESAAKDRLIFENESASVRDTADAVVSDMDAAPVKHQSTPGQRSIPSLIAHEFATRPEATLLQLGDAARATLYEPIVEARENAQLRVAASDQALMDVLMSNDLDPESDSLAKSAAYRVGLPSTKLENWRSQKRKIGGVELTRGEATWMALSTFDPAALENMMQAGWKLPNGRTLDKVTPQTIQQLFDFIGPQGEALTQMAFEHFNTYLIDGVNAANEKMTGRPLTDKRNVVPMFKSEEEYARFLSAGRTSAGMQDAVADSYGHLKRRTGAVNPLEIPDGHDFFDMFLEHTARMNRFAAYAAPARNAEMLLNDPALKAKIIEKNGEQGYNQIVDAVRSEVAGYGRTDEVAKQASLMNYAVAGAHVGGKLSVIMAQPLDLLTANAYGEGDYAALGAGLNELTQRGPAAVFREMKSVLSKYSGEWNHRYEGRRFAGEITNGIFKQRSHLRPPSLVDHAADPLQKTEQLAVAVPNYLAAKAAARAALGLPDTDFATHEDNPAWVQAVARGWGQRMIRGSNSSHGMELSGALRYAKKQPLAALVMNFYNQAGKVYSLFPMAADRLRRGDVKGAARFASAGLVGTFAFSVMQAALSTGEKDKEKYDFWERASLRSAKNLIGLNPAGAVVGVEQLINTAAGLPAFADNPVLVADTAAQFSASAVKLISLLLSDLDKEVDQEKVVKEWLKLGRSAGPLLAIPTPFLTDIVERARRGTPLPGLNPAKKQPKKRKKSLMSGAI